MTVRPFPSYLSTSQLDCQFPDAGHILDAQLRPVVLQVSVVLLAGDARELPGRLDVDGGVVCRLRRQVERQDRHARVGDAGGGVGRPGIKLFLRNLWNLTEHRLHQRIIMWNSVLRLPEALPIEYVSQGFSPSMDSLN